VTPEWAVVWWHKTEQVRWKDAVWLRRWILRGYVKQGQNHLPNKILVGCNLKEVFAAVRHNLFCFNELVPDTMFPFLLQNWMVQEVQDILENILQVDAFWDNLQTSCSPKWLSLLEDLFDRHGICQRLKLTITNDWVQQIYYHMDSSTHQKRTRLWRIFGLVSPKLLATTMVFWVTDFTEHFSDGSVLEKYISLTILSRRVFEPNQLLWLVNYLQNLPYQNFPVWWYIMGTLTQVVNHGMFSVVVQKLQYNQKALVTYLRGIRDAISTVTHSRGSLEMFISEDPRFYRLDLSTRTLCYSVVGASLSHTKVH
jgi:hypothetical protein